MTKRVNRKCTLVRRPQGRPRSADFAIVEAPVEAPPEGCALIAVEHLSIDPFIRAALNPGSAHPPVALGEVLPALGVGRVVESNCDGLRVGDPVCGTFMAQTCATLPPMAVEVVDDSRVPLRTYLGALGSTAGLTAYFGILEVGGVSEGDVVLMSAAAGAVGSIAGQIAKLAGARVIGIAGGPEKARFVCDELGFDACIDYKHEDVAARIAELAPAGVDVFFDNVGGPILDAALDNIANEGRVVLCGAMTQYDHMERVEGPSLYLRLAERHARMEGFTVLHFHARYEEGRRQLAEWLTNGALAVREHVDEGIENLPRALLRLFDGSHIGKLLLKVG